MPWMLTVMIRCWNSRNPCHVTVLQGLDVIWSNLSMGPPLARTAWWWACGVQCL